MKKSIIASAIAATVLSTSAYSMETASELAAMLESMPTVYGNVQLAWGHGDTEGSGSTGGLVDNGSTIGFKHSHQINDDLKAFIKIEFDGFNADDKGHGRGQIRLDEAFFGVQGDFGRVIIGSEDSEYEKNVSTINNYWEYFGSTTSAYSTGEGDLIQYSSNSMDGFKVFAAIELDNSGTDAVAAKAAVPGVSFAVDAVPATERQNPFQIGVGYSVDALTLALAYDSNDGQGDDAEGSIGLHADYVMDNFKIVGEVETTDDHSDVISFLGVYTAGANQYALGLSQTEYEGAVSDGDNAAYADGDSQTMVTLQALHNLSGNMYVYATAKFTSSEKGTTDADSEGVAIGATYYF